MEDFTVVAEKTVRWYRQSAKRRNESFGPLFSMDLLRIQQLTKSRKSLAVWRFSILTTAGLTEELPWYTTPTVYIENIKLSRPFAAVYILWNSQIRFSGDLERRLRRQSTATSIVTRDDQRIWYKECEDAGTFSFFSFSWLEECPSVNSQSFPHHIT